MSGRLVLPAEAAEQVAAQLGRRWAEAICAEVAAGGTEETADPAVFRASVRLRPGVGSGAAVARVGFDAWHDWRTAWADAEREARASRDVEVVRKPVTVSGIPTDAPTELRVDGVDTALAVVRERGARPPGVDMTRARRIARELCGRGGRLTPRNLKIVYKLPDADVETLLAVVGWLADHSDLSTWTLRQLPIPTAHTKWIEGHASLLRDVVGRDVARETRPRLAVVHLTYVDPDYRAGGGRWHDAWTTGDAHDLAYPPKRVLVVENRDCRLWFPPVDGTVVVEGGGKAAASLLAGIGWIRSARDVVYWGDIDADGFAILDRFRDALAQPGDDGRPGPQVRSILMDDLTLHRNEHLAVDRDPAGLLIGPASARLAHLTAAETAAYHVVATAGSTPVRRIEQERIPIAEAVAAL